MGKQLEILTEKANISPYALQDYLEQTAKASGLMDKLEQLALVAENMGIGMTYQEGAGNDEQN